jgi:quinoprotein glucose dehydrogenase
MTSKLNSRSLLTTVLLVGTLVHQVSLGAEPYPASRWHAYGNDSGGTRHSLATQITRDNINKLKPAWTYRTGEDYTGKKQAGRATFQATPLLIDGVLYLSTPSNRVIALNATTGEELWAFDPDIDIESGLYAEFTSRGVSYWRDGVSGEQRLFMGTIDGRLFALDISTGKRVRSFGDDGEINLTDGVGTVELGMYSVTSPPAVVNDTIIIGSAIGDNRRVRSEYGAVRAFDARSGVLRWSWDPIPRSETRVNWPDWDPAQAQITGAANAWAPLSADPERGLVFIPTGSPSPDYYGGERLGSNLYANSVVALAVETGEVAWHFQTVHHDLWDYDVSAQPVLVEVTRDNQKIPAVAQATKMGHLFFLHRDTGEPIFPVEERPVPQSDVPGERSWPTQPFPVITPPLVPQGLTPDEAWGLTPIDRHFAAGRIAQYRSEGIFTPPSLRGSIQYPGIAGGTNWGSLSFDPARELVILNTSRAPFVVTLLPREQYDREKAPGGYVERSPQLGTPYGLHREPLFSGLGVPLVKPPWGTLVAVSTRTGLIVWESTLGTIRDLTPLAWSKKWGTPSMGGPLTTASGVTFIAAAMDNYLRAFDTSTGEELWQARLPAGGQATPMTFQLSEDEPQYVVICAGGHGKLGTKLGDSVIAYTLQ